MAVFCINLTPDVEFCSTLLEIMDNGRNELYYVMKIVLVAGATGLVGQLKHFANNRYH